MSELERQLTEALKRLSAQYETEQRRHSGQVEALRQRVERQSEENGGLRQHVERQSGENAALQRRIEWLVLRVSWDFAQETGRLRRSGAID